MMVSLYELFAGQFIH